MSIARRNAEESTWAALRMHNEGHEEAKAGRSSFQILTLRLSG